MSKGGCDPQEVLLVTVLDTTTPKARPRHPEKAHRPDTEIQRKPDWIRVRAPVSKGYLETREIVKSHGLVTVCEEAGCPNIGECWDKKHATFMIMGEICTRACAFCNVATGIPGPLDRNEAELVARAERLLAFKLFESAQARWRTGNAPQSGRSRLRRRYARARPTSSSDPKDQEVISMSPDLPVYRSPMSSTGTPSHTPHNEPSERATDPGRWMAGCHIAEHHEAGIAPGFDVRPESSLEVPSPPTYRGRFVTKCHACSRPYSA
jgi:hypothetical protein